MNPGKEPTGSQEPFFWLLFCLIEASFKCSTSVFLILLQELLLICFRGASLSRWVKSQLIAGWKKKPPAVRKSRTQTFEKGRDVEAGRTAKRAFWDGSEVFVISEGSVLFCSSDTCTLTGCLLENICYQSSSMEAIHACSDATVHFSGTKKHLFFPPPPVFLSESRALLRHSTAHDENVWHASTGIPQRGNPAPCDRE